MELFQHIFGRVSRGYKGNAPGYQVAALSPELEGRKELIQRLNKLSFYRYRIRNGTNPCRYSFFRAGDGFLALGCVRMSHDLTGAAASFAHHFLWTEQDFLCSTQSPIHLLRTLSFLGSESELPDDRMLSAKNFNEHDVLEGSDEWRQQALFLADQLLNSDRLSIPMLVMPEADMWLLLSELFKILPRQEASQTSFSSLFCQATEYVDAYRLVFVPDKIHVPTSQVFGVFFPKDLLDVKGSEHELITFWRCHPGLGTQLLVLTNELRHGEAADTNHILAHLRILLQQAGKNFRSVIERLNLENILTFLLEDVDILRAYWRAGSPLTYELVKALVWEIPEKRFPVLLTCSRLEGADIVRHDALLDIAQKIATQATAPDLFTAVENSGLSQEFYVICESKLKIDEIMSLAEGLANEPGYTGALHRYVTTRILQNTEHQADRKIWRWLRQNYKADTLSQATVITGNALSARPPELPMFEDFQLDPQGYKLLANWAWNKSLHLGIPMSECVHRLFNSQRRHQFFNMVAQRLRNIDIELAENCLEAIVHICHPQNSELKLLIAAIQNRRGSRRLAEKLLLALKASSRIDPQLHKQLSELSQRKGILKVLSRMFGKNTV